MKKLTRGPVSVAEFFNLDCETLPVLHAINIPYEHPQPVCPLYAIRNAACLTYKKPITLDAYVRMQPFKGSCKIIEDNKFNLSRVQYLIIWERQCPTVSEL